MDADRPADLVRLPAAGVRRVQQGGVAGAGPVELGPAESGRVVEGPLDGDGYYAQGLRGARRL
ncbi:hypothetical protein ACIGPN_31205 [Streptomyces afghaniensis]|uniref:hypothetical protein n=1 Tax=Streptomyces afghaniensis TaxID=66865 RepID=UPI0037D92226